MTSRSWAVLAAVAVAGCPWGLPACAAAPALVVHATEGTTRTALRLQSGFATVLRADRRIDTVAIGDPRLVTAMAVHRDRDVYDLVLQPQAESGSTNMVVWFGDITTIWDLTIGQAPRTADLVYVVTSPPRSLAVPLVPAPAAAPSGPTGSPGPRSDSPTPPTAGTVPPAPSATAAHEAAAPGALEVRQEVGNVAAVFQIARASDGVVIRYHITNNSPDDLTVRSNGVLVRVNGHIVPYGMARQTPDRGRPDVLPRGATETGMIDAPSAGARQVQLILSFVPAGTADKSGGVELPLTFQPVFTGVDRLAASNNL